MSWEKKKFKELYAVNSKNGIYKSSQFHGSGTKIVNMGELFSYGFIGNQEMQRIVVSDKEKRAFGLKRGDLLFARRSLVESGAGKCSIVKNLSEPTVFESSLIRVRLNEKLCNPLFYYYWLQSHEGRAQISALVNGVNVKGIRSSALKEINVDLPKISVQNKIADFLYLYDDLIENNQKQIKLLEEAAQRLYKEWFVDLHFPGYEDAKIVDGVPEGWKWEKLGNLPCRLETGKRPKGGIDNSLKDGIPSIGAENVIGLGQYNYSSEKFIPLEFYSNLKKGKVKDRDILIYKDGAYIGRTSLFQDDFPHKRAAVNEHVFLLHMTQEKLQYYVFFTLYQKTYYYEMRKLNKNAAQPGINQKAMKSLNILIPDEKIIEKFDTNVSIYLKKIFILANQNHILQEARDRLLPKLMSGEIEV